LTPTERAFYDADNFQDEIYNDEEICILRKRPPPPGPLKPIGEITKVQRVGGFPNEVVYCKCKKPFVKDNQEKEQMFACDNCNIAAANISNYAYSLGLGSCFIGFVTLFLKFSAKARSLLKVPKGYRVFASLIVGYPAVNYSYYASGCGKFRI